MEWTVWHWAPLAVALVVGVIGAVGVYVARKAQRDFEAAEREILSGAWAREEKRRRLERDAARPVKRGR